MSNTHSTTSTIAARYAHAFFDLALEHNCLDAIAGDLTALKKTIESSTEFATFVKSPVYGNKDQQKAIAAIAEKSGFAEMTKNFLSLVTHNRRLFALTDIINAFDQRAAAHRGEMSAEAITATPLNQDQERRLRSEIESIVGKAVNLDTRVDPSLLGGMVVKVGSRMIDSSLKTKLNRLKTVMKEA